MNRLSSEQSPDVAAPKKASSGRRLHGMALGTVLAALMLTLLLEALDQTIVATGLPRIIGSLQGFDRYHRCVDRNVPAIDDWRRQSCQGKNDLPLSVKPCEETSLSPAECNEQALPASPLVERAWKNSNKGEV